MLTDSIALASVKVFTMATSIVSTMILCRTLPVADIGTYTTGNLIINVATLLSAFGLIDAVNYYYNGKEVNDRSSYVNTVFSLTFIFGLVAAAIILGAQGLITAYFHNPMLATIYAYIAFRPFLHNFSLGMQNLQVSIGKAKVVAIRNAAISTAKLCSILLASLYTKNITTIFICMLIVDIGATFFFYKVLYDNGVHINLFKPDWSKIREILVFCIPMGIYIQTNSLSRELDKIVIGYFESTENLSIYNNCSTRLPFDIISLPLLTLLIPLLTRCIRDNDYHNGSDLFRCYLKIGYIFTFAFGFGCILVAPQAVRFLYGSKYMNGVPIFIIYVIVDMVNFISYSLVLAAKGRTKDLMKVSCCALGINLIINLALYKAMGLTGPAIATVIVTFGVSSVLLAKSAKILKERIVALFDIKHILIYGVEAAVLFIILSFIKNSLASHNLHYMVTFLIFGGVFVGSMLLLNLNEIKKCFVLLNNINKNRLQKDE